MNWVQIVACIYGLVSIGVGAEAMIAKGSVPSIAAGGAIGILSVVGAVLATNRPTIGYALVALACLAMLGKFVPTLMKGFALYPAGLMVAAAVITLASLIIGHFMNRPGA